MSRKNIVLDERTIFNDYRIYVDRAKAAEYGLSQVRLRHKSRTSARLDACRNDVIVGERYTGKELSRGAWTYQGRNRWRKLSDKQFQRFLALVFPIIL